MIEVALKYFFVLRLPNFRSEIRKLLLEVLVSCSIISITSTMETPNQSPPRTSSRSFQRLRHKSDSYMNSCDHFDKKERKRNHSDTLTHLQNMKSQDSNVRAEKQFKVEKYL